MAETNFINKDGIVFDHETIADVPIPVPRGYLAVVKHVRPLLRFGGIGIVFVLWMLGCPLWITFLLSLPALWLFFLKVPIVFKPPENWLDQSNGFTEVGKQGITKYKCVIVQVNQENRE